ncbi:hypothetical protein M9H61_06200 [Thalassospira sp. GO-4]|jgi:FtsH-binding integral membrane protein|uniref:hypothetical protein n=1 Tax=Thalassospira sp. GO-4 TaxID=2946605 RepID=UPI002024EEB6|nr:hypothetical protein [Thalassospira sp. GO-4]URK19088.1 hypothetical protein M9H61_06200 [Thalassospira sp. GO-4]
MSSFDVVASVCAKLGSLKSSPLKVNKFEKISLILAAVFWVSAVIVAVTYSINPDRYLLISVNFLLIFFLISVFLLIFFHLVLAAKEMRNPGYFAFSVVLDNYRDELNLADQFRGFSVKELELLKHRNILGIDHLKKRTSLMLGAVDKIGVFPAIIALFLSNYRLFQSENLSAFDGYLMWAIVFMSLMYLFSFYVAYAVHQMERLNFTIELAITRNCDRTKRTQVEKK